MSTYDAFHVWCRAPISNIYEQYMLMTVVGVLADPPENTFMKDEVPKFLSQIFNISRAASQMCHELQEWFIHIRNGLPLAKLRGGRSVNQTPNS
jgi:hypothetical protein